VTAIETEELPEGAGWGPTSRRVAANLKRLRKARGMSTTRLSAALKDDVGHAIPATGITRIEKGQRRVDADDLVALALALNVSPLTLLMPSTSGDESAELTTDKQLRSRIAWRWAVGQEPAVDWEPGDGVNVAEPGADPAIAHEAAEREQEYGRLRPGYMALALPAEQRKAAEHSSVRLARQLADLVEDLVSPEIGEGVEAARVRMALRRHQQLGIDLEELQEQYDPKPIVHPGVGFEQLRERLAAEGGVEDVTDKDDPRGD
jgi:transcriptional regulator with XRE-family HTH domain